MDRDGSLAEEANAKEKGRAKHLRVGNEDSAVDPTLWSDDGLEFFHRHCGTTVWTRSSGFRVCPLLASLIRLT
jgi:hypothetical protein